MVSGEVTLQILATLSGAALLSLLLIAFINAETKSRLSQTDNEAENVWRLLASKFPHRKSTKQNSQNSTLHNRSSEISTLRQLKWVDDETKHPIRHSKHKESQRIHSTTTATTSTTKSSHCYTGNEVLIIIGVTCLLNFAFILLVMTCVHYCSSSGLKSEQYPSYRLESLLIESEDSDDSRRCWDRGNSLVSLHHLPLYRHKTPSHSMEQLLFVD